MKAFGLEIRKAGTLAGLYQDVDRVLGAMGGADTLVPAEMQVSGVAHALQKMLRSDRHFSICTIDQCAELTGVIIRAERYNLYRVMHCHDWREMEPEFRIRLIAMVLDDFRGILNPSNR